MLKYFTLCIATFLTVNYLHAQTSLDSAGKYTIMAEAQVQQTPPQITLNWQPLTNGTTISIYRKTKKGTLWGNPIANLGIGATSYTDNSVSPDSAYEYYLFKNGGSVLSTGYIYAGIRVPAIHNRGTLLCLVDSTFTDSCKSEIEQLINDISGDGWAVLRADFARTATDVTIKNHILAQKQAHPSLSAVLLIGHLAVPYSGDLNPDAHTDHKGAWPADVFYGELDGSWTDNAVNNTTASRATNDNIPGDGKWDQSTVPSAVDLQVSRIDFANMPAFAKTEIEMMRSYLNKNHAYKTGALQVTKKQVIDDNFGISTGEPFAANGLRLSSLIGRSNTASGDFLGTLDTGNRQWAYGCGGGSYTSCSGVGNTAAFTSKNINAIYTMLFGSYFGDWDAQNNLLRAPLCTDEPALASCWAGRPHWFFHHMALGENIGYSTLLTQNNSGGGPLYNVYYNNAHQGVHIALMGDLTLRTEYVKPASNLSITSTPTAGAILNWSASAEPALDGYYVYRSDSALGTYTLRSGLVTGTTFTDSFGTAGTKYYMVRAAKLQATPSGNYYNLSLGAGSSANISYPMPDNIEEVIAAQSLSLYPNPGGNTVHLSLTAYSPAQAQVCVTDQYGKKVITEHMKLNSGSNNISLNTTPLPAGIYNISVLSEHGILSKKWVKIAE